MAVADEHEAGRAACAKKLGVERTYADYREMLAKEQPQIVAVAPRWLDCHRDMAIACAAAGAHIFMEKPLSRTLAEADEMIAACDRAKVKCAIAHQTRYSPKLARVKELIAHGQLGEILELRGRGKEDPRGGGEDLMVLGTHIFDLMRFIAGDARWCSARVFDGGKSTTKATVRSGNEGIGPLAGDTLDAMYGFDHNVSGYFASHRPTDRGGSRFGLTVYGTKGVLDIATGGLGTVHFLADPNWSAARSKKPWVEVSTVGLGQPEPLKDRGLHGGNVAIAQDLLRCIEANTQPLGSIRDGRAALEMILAVYESHRLGAPVSIPLVNRQHPLALIQ